MSDTIEQAGAMPAPRRPAEASMPRWLGQGAATALLIRPRWEGLTPGPALVAALVLLDLAGAILVSRWHAGDDAMFNWQAVAASWAGVALPAWAAYAVGHRGPARDEGLHAPSVAHLVTMLLAQSLAWGLMVGWVLAVMFMLHLWPVEALGFWGGWAAWLAPGIWLALAQAVLIWRAGDRRPAGFAAALLALSAAFALQYVARQEEFWLPDDAPEEAQRQPPRLTQEIMEAQPRLLDSALMAIAPQRAGTVDLYALTYAPYDEAVFPRESRMVADVIARRFDAGGRTLQLVNDAGTIGSAPWATPLNLRRAIERFARIMNRDEDVLFLHLTSHGARDAALASYFWPVEVEPLRPAELKRWLDEAGVKHRVISVSACYSGSWIAPLADEGTLVMTAADAEHTSYGCGSKSELTFFGRAVYDELLRNETLSFEEAHAKARVVIDRREKEAGKDDGYSNPQISVGERIREPLAALRARLERGAPAGGGQPASPAGKGTAGG